MTDLTLNAVKQAVTDAGVEIFDADDTRIRVAERVRMHLMESGVVITCGDAPLVTLTVRGQRSDFPSIDEAGIFDRVRNTFAATMRERGFEELDASTRNIHNPSDESQLLDVWYEVRFGRGHSAMDELVDDVRWALGVRNCIEP